MISRLRAFVIDVGGELFTGGFWKGVVKQSLQSALLSAAEAGFKALGRFFKDVGERMRERNGRAAAEEKPAYEYTPPPAAAPRWPAPVIVPKTPGSPWDDDDDWRPKPAGGGGIHTYSQSAFDPGPHGSYTQDPEVETDETLFHGFTQHMGNRNS